MTELGGFFASLKLKTDTASFDQGKKNLDEMTKSTKGLRQEYNKSSEDVIEKTMKMGQAFVGLASAIGKVTFGLAASLTAMGKIAGDSAAKLSSEATKANITTGQAATATNLGILSKQGPDAVASEMANWQKALSVVSVGKGDQYKEMITALSFLGLQGKALDAFANKNKKGTTDELMRAILSQLDKTAPKDFNDVYQKTLNFSPVVAEIFSRARSLGISSMDMYNRSQSLNWRTGGDIDTSNKASYQYDQLGIQLDNLGKMLGDSVNKNIIGHLQRLVDWMDQNKDAFAKAADLIGGALKGVFNLMEAIGNSPIFKTFAAAAGWIGEQTAQGLAGNTKEGVIGQSVSAVQRFWSTGELGENSWKNTAFDLGVAIPAWNQNVNDPQFKEAQKIKSAYEKGGMQQITINNYVDGKLVKVSTVQVDTQTGIEKVLSVKAY